MIVSFSSSLMFDINFPFSIIRFWLEPITAESEAEVHGIVIFGQYSQPEGSRKRWVGQGKNLSKSMVVQK